MRIVHDDPHGTILQLLIRRPHVRHVIPAHITQTDHRDSRDHVQNQLLRRARLHACGTRDGLGTYHGNDRNFSFICDLGVGIADDARGEAT